MFDPLVFDGTRLHEVTSFNGKRYSIVAYTCTNFENISVNVQRQYKAAAGIPSATMYALVALLACVSNQPAPNTPLELMQVHPTNPRDPEVQLRIARNKAEAVKRNKNT